jgi:hypothetical protein
MPLVSHPVDDVESIQRVLQLTFNVFASIQRMNMPLYG